MEAKGTIILYDVKSLPKGLTLMNVLYALKKDGNLVWDSSLGGIEPSLAILSIDEQTNKERFPEGIKIIDVKEI